MEKKTLLITGCGGHFMADTIECFRGQDIEFEIIGVASSPDPFIIPLCDKYFRVPMSNDPGYIDLLLNICKVNHVDVLIPTIDDEIYPLYLRKAEFKEIGTMVSADKAGMYGSDKVKFVQELKNLGLPYPKFEVIYSTQEFIDAAKRLGYSKKPICAKLANKAGSRGVRIIRPDAFTYNQYENQKPTSKYVDRSAFVQILECKPATTPVLLQEYLPGDEYSVDLLADHGKMICATGRRNVGIDNSIPMDSILEWNEDAISICRQFVEKCGLDGNIGFDFIFDEFGNPAPIELNARITATISLSKWGKCNMAYYQVLRLLGKDLPNIQPQKDGRRLVRRLFPVYFDENDNAVICKNWQRKDGEQE